MPLTVEQAEFAAAIKLKMEKYSAVAADPELDPRIKDRLKHNLSLMQALHVGLLKAPPTTDAIIDKMRGLLQALKAWKPKAVPGEMVALPNLSDIRPIAFWRELILDGGIYYTAASGKGLSRAPAIGKTPANGGFCFVILVAKPDRVLVGDRALGGHTTLSNGADVLYAGEVFLDSGHIVTWSNDSGHYRPPKEMSGQAAHLLPKDKFVPQSETI